MVEKMRKKSQVAENDFAEFVVLVTQQGGSSRWTPTNKKESFYRSWDEAYCSLLKSFSSAKFCSFSSPWADKFVRKNRDPHSIKHASAKEVD